MKILPKDIRILNQLLKNSKIPFIQMSKETDIADTTIHFRVNKLKEQEVIKRYTIELDLDKVGLVHKVLLVFKIKQLAVDVLTFKRARDFLENLKKDKRIGFLALAEDKLTVIALFVSSDKASFSKAVEKFKTHPDIETIQVIDIDFVEKYFIHEV